MTRSQVQSTAPDTFKSALLPILVYATHLFFTFCFKLMLFLVIGIDFSPAISVERVPQIEWQLLKPLLIASKKRIQTPSNSDCLHMMSTPG